LSQAGIWLQSIVRTMVGTGFGPRMLTAWMTRARIRLEYRIIHFPLVMARDGPGHRHLKTIWSLVAGRASFTSETAPINWTRPICDVADVRMVVCLMLFDRCCLPAEYVVLKAGARTLCLGIVWWVIGGSDAIVVLLSHCFHIRGTRS
jgi:hypothetical protein